MNDDLPPSDSPDDLDSLLPKHGGYEVLRSFRTAQLIYDATVIFCDRFIDKRSRTHDQMVQAARSGVRNIEEGSMASGTSKKTELKLTNVARASLVELLGDYKDFLRHRHLPIWDKNSPQALAVRRRYQSDQSDQSDETERLYRARSGRRALQGNPPPTCPECGQPMRLRQARQGPRTGQDFWGCPAYPECRGTRPAGPNPP